MARSPRLIVDYACGAGELLARLGGQFPDSCLVGLDGSPFLLGLARRRLRHRKRVRLIETALPNLDLSGIHADLAVYSFPNMVPARGAYNLRQARRVLTKSSQVAARRLAFTTERQDQSDIPDAILSTLLLGRLVSLNLRRVLKPAGLCVRVEYGRVRRYELPESELMRISFEEGSLDLPVDGILPEQWFRVLASSYFHSRTIEDVRQQSGGRKAGSGGYLITVLRAI